jgi:UDP-N-acetylglucosamine 3-dehydrogenase
MTQELRVGVIGTGQMGGWHVETWGRIPSARVVAVADFDEERARAVVRRQPIDWYADWHIMVERDDIDAVTIAVPTCHHAEVVLGALAAGKHVLVEKPIAAALEDGLRMTAAARAANRKLMVGHVERFNPAVQKLAALVSDDVLGRVFRIHATRVGPLPTRIQDAGVAIDLATHDLDAMQFVLGRDISSVYAQGARFVHPGHEDMLACLLRFGGDGPFGLLDVNWLTPEKRRELTLIGEKGMLHASYLTQDVWFTEATDIESAWKELAVLRGAAESAVTKFALRRVEPLRAELEAFATCILEDLPEPVSGEDGCRALIAALAVRDSAEHSRPVNLLGMPGHPVVRAVA